MNLKQILKAIKKPKKQSRIARTVYVSAEVEAFLNKHFYGKGQISSLFELLILNLIEDGKQIK